MCVWWQNQRGGGAVVSAGYNVLSCDLKRCVYGDTIRVEVVLLCLLVVLYWVARWHGVCMVTPSKRRWFVCVCWLQCTELPVDMVCVWWNHRSGGGAVVSASCNVLSCQLVWCVYGDTIQVELVLWLLVALYWFACRYSVCMLTPFKWRWCYCVYRLHCTELRVDMVYVCWHNPSGDGAVVSTSCTVLSCQ